MNLKNKIKNYTINNRQTSKRRKVNKDSVDIIDVEKTMFIVVIDAGDYNDSGAITADINIIHSELIGSLVVVCDAKSIFLAPELSNVRVVTFEDVSMFGRLNNRIINEISNYKDNILLAIKPVKSRLARHVVSKFETGLLVTVCDDNINEQYDLVIREGSNDIKKKIETVVFYLKQLNIRR